MTVLVAGVGNVLRGDDGFGVEAVRRLTETGPPQGAACLEFGIDGIGLVQELMGGYDALIVLDAVAMRRAPGTLRLMAARVPSLSDIPRSLRSDFLADMHWAEPARAMVLAKALGVLPARTWILGCETAATEDLHIGLGSAAAQALPRAVQMVRRLVGQITADGAWRLCADPHEEVENGVHQRPCTGAPDRRSGG